MDWGLISGSTSLVGLILAIVRLGEWKARQEVKLENLEQRFKNNDFITLAITLDNSDNVTVINWYTLTVSTDLSLVQYANVLYKLEQVADGTYKAIPYSYAMGQQTLTGVAAENAAVGASFSATTILPE